MEEALARVPDSELEADVVRRALALRRQGRIGILWAEQGRFYISESEFDPWGSRWPVSVAELLALVERVEAGPERKPVASEGGLKRSRVSAGV